MFLLRSFCFRLVLKVDGETVGTQLILQTPQTWHRIYVASQVAKEDESLPDGLFDQLTMMMLIHMAIDRKVNQLDLVTSDPLDALAWQADRSHFLQLQLAAANVPHTPLLGLVFSNEGTARNWCKSGMNIAGLH